MYIEALSLRPAKRQSEGPDLSPQAWARLALARVRKALAGFVPGMVLPLGRLRRNLQAPLPAPALERERLFALGWLDWLEGEHESALARLADVECRCLAAGADTAGMAELPPLEANVLLARAAYWLARCRLRLGQEALAPYEAVLRKLAGSPQGTAWFVDLLWRAGRSDRAEQVWKSVRSNKRVLGCDEGPLLDARLHLKKGELGPAEKALREATPKSGPVWVEWHLLLAWAQANPRRAEQAEQELALAARGPYPPAALQEWANAVRARVAGQAPPPASPAPGWREFLQGQQARADGQDAAPAYRAALGMAALVPFARYGLTALGLDSPSEVLALGPPVLLGQRLRARQAALRFLGREAGHAEMLELLTQAERDGYLSPLLAHARRLGQQLASRDVSREALEQFIQAEPEGPARRNAARVARELAEARLPAQDQEALLPLLGAEADHLRVRLALASGRAELLAGVDTPQAGLARQLLSGEVPAEMPEVCRPVGHATALHEAVKAGDMVAVVANLEDHAAWRHFAAPPRFVVAALEAVVPAQPALHRPLAAWLQLWPAGNEALQAQLDGNAAPPGVAPAVWALHQAARSLAKGEAVRAWRHFHRAKEAGELPQEAALAEAPLRRRAEAEALTRCLPAGAPRGERLLRLAALLEELPAGADILLAALRGEEAAVRQGLASLEGELPPELHHHLAILAWREAQSDEAAVPRAWRHWLAVLPTFEPAARKALLDHLLGWHQKRISEQLARGTLEPARRHWAAVGALAAHGDELKDRAERFRDELATHYLVQTREAMRHGEAPHGWKADYERGLNLLRRMLSLDRDNVRLLTAIAEICAEWSLDFYNTEDRSGMGEQVARHLPLMNHLGRLIEGKPGELAARAALAEFLKFKGFSEPGREKRVEAYREALKWDPANANVRDLLRDMGEEVPGAPERPDEEGQEHEDD